MQGFFGKEPWCAIDKLCSDGINSLAAINRDNEMGGLKCDLAVYLWC